MAVITIAHSLGSNGSEIGRIVAHEMGLFYVDRQIVQGVARRLGISEKRAASFAGNNQGLVDHICEMVGVIGNGMMLGSLVYMSGTSSLVNAWHSPIGSEEYAVTAARIITAAARLNSVVIAGHGANYILADWPGALHVRMTANDTIRAARINQRDNVDLEEARQRIVRSDHEHAQYIKKHFHADWCNSVNYHLCVDTSGVESQAVAKTLSAVALCRKSSMYPE